MLERQKQCKSIKHHLIKHQNVRILCNFVRVYYTHFCMHYFLFIDVVLHMLDKYARLARIFN